MKSRFHRGQIVKLDAPGLRHRSHWRYIVLDSQDDSGCHMVYCLRSPPYRSQDRGRVFRIKPAHLTLVWSP
jgi:hypothetical protein